MPRLVVMTNGGQEVGEIETYTGHGRGFTPRARYSLDFLKLTELMDRAQRMEERAEQIKEDRAMRAPRR